MSGPRDGQSQPDRDTLSLAFELNHPPEKVWRALTEPALLSQWLLPILDAELVVGRPFTFQAPPQPGWDGVVNCRFLEIETGKKLTFSWIVDDLDTMVTFSLSPTVSGTYLSIVHSGFSAGQRQELGGARFGWKMMSERLVDLLEQPF